MTTNPQDPTPPTEFQRPRWRRKRYWILGVVVLLLLAMSPNFGVWYRRHQMIQHLFGGYWQRYPPLDCPFRLVPDAWPRRFFDSQFITPFDRLELADVTLERSSDLQLLAQECDLTSLFIKFPKPHGGDDSELAALEGLTSLEHLIFRRLSIKGDGLKCLNGMPKLHRLTLELSGVTHAIDALSGHPAIRYLDIEVQRNAIGDRAGESPLESISSDVVRAIRGMPELEELELDVGSATSTAYDSLSTNPRLAEVTIFNAELDSPVMTSLSRVASLRQLTLYVCRIEPGALTALGKGNLVVLDWDGAFQPLPDFLRGIDTMPNLQAFVGCQPESDDEIAMVAKCFPNLSYLALGNTAAFPPDVELGPFDDPNEKARGTITDEGMKPLLRLSKLKKLRLGRNAITDTSIETLVRMQQLHELSVDETQITVSGVEKLKTLMPNTKVNP